VFASGWASGVSLRTWAWVATGFTVVLAVFAVVEPQVREAPDVF
jgi:hypothetical protein